MALSPAITRRDDYRLGPSTRWETNKNKKVSLFHCHVTNKNVKVKKFSLFHRHLSFSWGEDRQQSERWKNAAKNWNDKFLSSFYGVAKNVDKFLWSFQKQWYSRSSINNIRAHNDLIVMTYSAVLWWKDWIIWSYLYIYQIVCIKQ